MEPQQTSRMPRLVEYDAVRRRLWILGQRCHHGATGALVAAAGAAILVAERRIMRSVLAVSAGSALMVHDWKDRSMWFERGWQNQP